MLTIDDITYKIVSFDKTTGHIEVYYEGLDFLVPIELHLNPETNLYPVGDDLKNLILAYCPLHILNKKIAIDNGVENANEIEALVEPLPEDSLVAKKLKEEERKTISNNLSPNLSDDDIEKMIELLIKDKTE